MDQNPYSAAGAAVREREISSLSNGYILIKANEGATELGYAWKLPTIPDLNCVDLVDENYGNSQTGVVQYLFKAKQVSIFCSDTILVDREDYYEDCRGCTETIKIAVSPQVADDPSSVSSGTTILPTDNAFIISEKNRCDINDQL